MNLLSAQTLAAQLLQTYGLKSWKFKFDRARLRFGCCNFSTKTISLSRVLTELNPPDKVRDTLLHEIAHALVGKNHAHGQKWKAKARELGCSPRRCYQYAEIVIPKGKYTAKCESCEKEFQAQRKRRGVACRACCKAKNGGKYSSDFHIVFREN
jgi:predicted SprT family Zn-dependent metalloprotease